MCRDVKIVYFENRLSLQKSGFFYYLDWTVRQLIFNIIGSRVREHRRSMAPCTCIALTYRQIQKVVSILGNCAVINDGRRMLKSAVIGQQHLQCMNDASIMSWRLKWCRPCLLSGDDHVSRWRVLEAWPVVISPGQCATTDTSSQDADVLHVHRSWCGDAASRTPSSVAASNYTATRVYQGLFPGVGIGALCYLLPNTLASSPAKTVRWPRHACSIWNAITMFTKTRR